MRINFGSTYAIKYNYILMKAYGYASVDSSVRNLVEIFSNNVKNKDDISAINPEQKIYYYKTADKNDSKFEAYAKAFNVPIKKVNPHKIESAIITSVGRASDEIGRISDALSKYEHSKMLERESYLP